MYVYAVRVIRKAPQSGHLRSVAISKPVINKPNEDVYVM